MYYRRKLILAILEKFGGKLDKTSFQKILFLVTRKQVKQAFDFVPYLYGCFSFQANQDLLTLSKYNLVQSATTPKTSQWQLLDDNANFYAGLSEKDQSAIRSVKIKTQQFSQPEELIRHTYLNYPFYATKSKIAKKILTNKEMAQVEKEKSHVTAHTIFTIGYEGSSPENYLNKLIKNNVKLLCDVRKNPFSMKYGFSKRTLQHTCESVGIEYIHIPDLGIESNKRKGLHTASDYNKLFVEYRQTTLKENHDAVKHIYHLVKRHRRVAITCFEKEVHACHRGVIIEALTQLPDWHIPCKNL